jgi:hypothetical protein
VVDPVHPVRGARDKVREIANEGKRKQNKPRISRPKFKDYEQAGRVDK